MQNITLDKKHYITLDKKHFVKSDKSVKRYSNGSKYEGKGSMIKGEFFPNGIGTFYFLRNGEIVVFEGMFRVLNKEVSGADRQVQFGSDLEVSGADRQVQFGSDLEVSGADRQVQFGSDLEVSGAGRQVQFGSDLEVSGADRQVQFGSDLEVSGAGRQVQFGSDLDPITSTKRWYTGDVKIDYTSRENPRLLEHGKGILYYSVSDKRFKLDGSFENGVPKNGTITNLNNDKIEYIGSFDDKGRYCCDNGVLFIYEPHYTLYVGGVSNGRPNGDGISLSYDSNTSSFQSGVWKDGSLHEGEWYYGKDKNSFYQSGEFNEDSSLKNGIRTYRLLDGTIILAKMTDNKRTTRSIINDGKLLPFDIRNWINESKLLAALSGNNITMKDKLALNKILTAKKLEQPEISEETEALLKKNFDMFIASNSGKKIDAKSDEKVLELLNHDQVGLYAKQPLVMAPPKNQSKPEESKIDADNLKLGKPVTNLGQEKSPSKTYAADFDSSFKNQGTPHLK